VGVAVGVCVEVPTGVGEGSTPTHEKPSAG
jgi:hypothetical protein